jgi:hypothetical protein
MSDTGKNTNVNKKHSKNHLSSKNKPKNKPKNTNTLKNSIINAREKYLSPEAKQEIKKLSNDFKNTNNTLKNSIINAREKYLSPEAKQEIKKLSNRFNNIDNDIKLTKNDINKMINIIKKIKINNLDQFTKDIKNIDKLNQNKLKEKYNLSIEDIKLINKCENTNNMTEICKSYKQLKNIPNIFETQIIGKIKLLSKESSIKIINDLIDKLTELKTTIKTQSPQAGGEIKCNCDCNKDGYVFSDTNQKCNN